LPYIRASGMPLVRGIDGRADAAEALTDAQKVEFRARRAEFREQVRDVLGGAGALLAPAVHDAPFALDAPVEVFDRFRHEAMRLLCVAGMAGLPQVVMPAGRIEGAPFGVSLIGPQKTSARPTPAQRFSSSTRCGTNSSPSNRPASWRCWSSASTSARIA